VLERSVLEPLDGSGIGLVLITSQNHVTPGWNDSAKQLFDFI
jgi:hypothetical protein